MTNVFRKNAIALVASSIGYLPLAMATNGMNMEGYGPISTAMGGAASAYDNGTAGMANNPATLQLGAAGHRVDGALGVLGPSITAQAQAGAPAQDSSATSFFMPALGWTHQNDALTWGFGVFAQGGMGAEYAGGTPMSAMTTDEVRSELGVGRVIFPVAYRVSPKLTVGASLDYVWAGLDIKMAVGRDQLIGMAGAPAVGMIEGMTGAVTTARIDFSDSSSYTGAAAGQGFGGKLGFTYEVNPTLRIGASYHAKTHLEDLTTSSADFSVNGNVIDSGNIAVNDFQWPASTSIGMAWQASDALMVVADFKRVAWSDVMEAFNMTYSSAAFAGGMPMTMTQNWKDQTVTMIGAAYKISEATVLRAGFNRASNPVPDETVNPLFPATVENHYTFGLGHQINLASSIEVSATIAPKVTVTSATGGEISHSQNNFQLMYSYRY